MRLTAGESGPHHVYLDGERLSRVFVCDTAEGWAEIAKLDERGELVIDREAGEVATERVFGRITVEPIA
jgi:hypothetical protein